MTARGVEGATSVEWLWQTDADLVLVDLSPPVPAAAALDLPMQQGDGLLGLEAFAEPAARQALADAVGARVAFCEDVLTPPDADGRVIHYRLVGVPMADRRNKFLGYRGSGSAAAVTPAAAGDDAEAARRLLTLLDEALARKDELEWERLQSDRQTLGARLASLAHEIRTPLNAIIGFAEAIDERIAGDDPARCLAYAANIRDGGLHLLGLLDGLLEGAAGEAERARPWPLIDLHEVLGGVLRILADQAAKAEVRLVDEVTAPPPLACDQRALRQILLNLLSNAVKYTPRGGTVTLSSALRGADRLDLVVADSGIGIAPEQQQKIFERFYRVADGRGRTATPGSGLGLAIARELARGLGGEITVESTLGRGSRFTFTLPVAAD